MPVVLFEAGGVARSGHFYGDRTGFEYEYPAGRYEGWITTGDRFVYSAPRVGYIGCGIVGDISPSSTPNRLICQILAPRFFEEPVRLKDASGSYYEADPTYWQKNVYFGQGVRPLSDARFEAIMMSAGVPSPSPNPDPVALAYADPTTARRVEEISMAVAQQAMLERFGVAVVPMAHNNPGYDIRVGPVDQPVRYVEVKGTQSSVPAFFMSDGERKFSIRNHDRYSIVVVTGVDIVTGTHDGVHIRDGRLDQDDVPMSPSQWRGRLTD